MISLTEKSIEAIMLKIGMIPIDTETGKIYKSGDGYYKLSFVQGLGGYVIEYAETEDEIKKNFFEDIGVINKNCTEKELEENLLQLIA